MYQVTSLSTADKPYYSVICRYTEKDSQKRRKLVLPVRELKPSPNDIFSHFQAIASKMRSKHVSLLNLVDVKLLLKCLLVCYYHSTGSTESKSVALAEKLMALEGKANNRRVSFREPPEAIEYDEIHDEEENDNNLGTDDEEQTREKATTIFNDDEEDDDFAF